MAKRINIGGKIYTEVKFASDMPLCPDCEEEAFCVEHQMHFADCSCFGCTEDNVEYIEINQILYARQME